MDTYHVVLYVHLLSLLVATGAASVLIVCAFRLRAARTLADAVPFALLSKSTAKAFPLAVVGLFGSGAYMTSHVWTWGTGWIGVGIAGLALVSLQGPLVGGRAGAAIGAALRDNGPGPLGERARAAVLAPAHWVVTFANPTVVLAIVWIMTTKPGTASAVAAIVVAYAAGAAAALPFTRAPALEAEPAADAAG